MVQHFGPNTWDIRAHWGVGPAIVTEKINIKVDTVVERNNNNCQTTTTAHLTISTQKRAIKPAADPRLPSSVFDLPGSAQASRSGVIALTTPTSHLDIINGNAKQTLTFSSPANTYTHGPPW